MKPILKKLYIFIFVVVCAFATTSCKSCKEEEQGETKYYDNENDALVFSSQAVDKVFNPFYSTTGPDSNVVGMTQIGMLGNNAAGKVTYGDSEAVVVKDYAIEYEYDSEENVTFSTYKFVLKNNVRFSNGSYLTIKDVLFNLYVYLDPVYTGSSTIYSTEIVGLQEYRTQEADEDDQDSFKTQFDVKARSRISALSAAAKEILKDKTLDEAGFVTKLTEYQNGHGDAYANIVSDYKKAKELFKEELESDYSNSIDSWADTVFKDENGKLYKGAGDAKNNIGEAFTTDVEVFLYNEGYISWNKKEAKFETTLSVNDPSEFKNTSVWTKEKAIEEIMLDKIPDDTVEIISYWATASELFNYLSNYEMQEYYKDGSTRKYKNISGIQFANRSESVTVNGKAYGVPEYDETGRVVNGNEVLTIKIKKIDPKAIWNFAFAVAPMYYYSDEYHITKFDYEENFGVEYGSVDFMNNVIKNPDRIGVPVGAGPYAASKSSGGITNISSGDFYNLGVIYFERNPYYVLGTPTIKKVRFSIVAENQMIDTLYSGGIDFIEPNASPDNIAELAKKVNDGISYKSVQTSGYGYIGINAKYVPDIEVRQAIMHAIDIEECVRYYKGDADPIYRSMSKASFAYPDDAISYYPYVGSALMSKSALNKVSSTYKDYLLSSDFYEEGYTMSETEQIEFIQYLVENAGYKLNANGVYQKGDKILRYTFTIAGQETDHPAYQALVKAKELLNKAGFEIEVKTDAQALKKLNDGKLTVWAAAWGSTIDPDMYQVYHKESRATSVKNWGYDAILANNGGIYDEENEILDYLSELIERARETNVELERKQIYAEALDEVMKLAIELPTYQRNDLFAYNSNKIDSSSLYQNPTSYKGLTSDMWKVSLNVEK